MCLLVSWLALILVYPQFALVHYFTKYGSGECYFSMESSEDSDSDDDWSSRKIIEPMVSAGLSFTCM